MAKQLDLNPNQPVHTVRHRSLKASIWRNETVSGPMYKVLLVRSYQENNEWHDTHSLGHDDPMNAAKLLYDSHSFITAQRAKDARPATKPASGPVAKKGS